MRIRSSVLHYLGVILVAFSALQAAPLVVSTVYQETVRFPFRIYVIPALIALVIGCLLVVLFRPRPLTGGSSMAVGALGWFALSLVGAIPFWLALDITFLDAVFETVSGFTTTGATVLSGLQGLPKSLLLWRALTQWIGGLGIFTLFLFVVRESGMRHALLGAEAHKASSQRFSPGIFGSLRILWAIYGGLTLTCALCLWLEGMSIFDASAHALTTISTGGFSTYDASLGWFAATGHPHAVWMEWTVIVFMLLGGTSFLVHWNLLRRRWRAVGRDGEWRLWLGLLAVGIAVVMVGDRGRIASVGWASHIRASVFQVVSIATTTGFATVDIAAPTTSALARQVFLMLMLIGGCVGSTSGGLKVLRLRLLGARLRQELRRVTKTANEVKPLSLGGQPISVAETDRATAIGVAWIGALLVVWMLTTAFSSFDGWGALSGAASALGNVGPTFIEPAAFAGAPAVVKVCYIVAMVAGRLEILPFLLIFSRRVWR